MTFDLFADLEPKAAPPAQAAAAALPRTDAARYPMDPTGEPNRWLYRGVLVVYDGRRQPGSSLGHWRTVEGIGMPVLHSDDRVEVCRAIGARLDGSDHA
ncbi:hypothetical protein [Variovorax sp. EBFNA2]|uniref:hypothetical protein n=1 Tax=Variovorax sp. EBFNA2 TaxID=3342097 RepID=UPI0029C05307|nr:hypothetical protein [Variovorax boronicumulans]WPG35355.1 hypothetical protein RZE79_17870 [Variovorax boronicumulans]